MGRPAIPRSISKRRLASTDSTARRAITTPLLITDPDDEQFWPSQSQQLYDRLSCAKKLIAFRSADGAGSHCEPLAAATRDARILDWLERYLDSPYGQRSSMRRLAPLGPPREEFCQDHIPLKCPIYRPF